MGEEKSCDHCGWRENECYGEEVCEHYTEENKPEKRAKHRPEQERRTCVSNVVN